MHHVSLMVTEFGASAPSSVVLDCMEKLLNGANQP